MVHLERAPQLLEVVDLAVEDDGVAAARGRHRLMAGRRQVDDRQPLEAEAHAAVDEDPFVVGAAVVHGRGHPPQQLLVRRAAVPVVDARYATHGLDRFALARIPGSRGETFSSHRPLKRPQG
jgi:hypothetical protein